MTPGKLQLGGLEARVDADGWASEDAGLAESLSRAFPVGDVAAGVGWVRAFWEAARTTGASVTQAPEADAAPGVVH